MTPDRFLTLNKVGAELNTSRSQIYARIRAPDTLRARKFGGRGVWRVQRSDLEDFIEATCRETS